MPGAPRFTQKPSIQQTSTGDLLMECQLEADPQPTISWQHASVVIPSSARVIQSLSSIGENLYKASLIIKEPNAGDGGAYKCTAKNQFGESNANINLNFAGGGGDEGRSRGPTFVSKPRIIPKDGGALIVMECKVKSSTTPTAKWMKDGSPLSMGGLYHAIFTDLGDQTYLCQLEIRGPTTADAGNYRCTLRNDQGETNANLALNFEEPDPSERQERMSRRSPSVNRKDAASPRPPSRGPGSRPGSPKKHMKSREGTPKRNLKAREGSPSKRSMRSRTSTPTLEVEAGKNSLAPEDAASGESSRRSSRTDKMDTDSVASKRKPDGLPPPPAAGDEKKLRTASPAPSHGERLRSPAPPSSGPNPRDKYTRPPIVMESVKSQMGKPGSTIVLQVEWQCHSSTIIEWFKDGAPLKASNELSASFDGTNARLSIRNLTEELTGLYKCHAICEYGEGQSSAMVKIDQDDSDLFNHHSKNPSLVEPTKDEKKSSSSAQEKEKEKSKKNTLNVNRSEDEESGSGTPKRKRSTSKSPAPSPKVSRAGSLRPEASEQESAPSSRKGSVRNDPDDVRFSNFFFWTR
ncbi:unnamed protein product [Auanema sp. JU1783]|nr:unnamed protein product [Auanema sp. JU1783]